jgi:hypothetical protein
MGTLDLQARGFDRELNVVATLDATALCQQFPVHD